jgi:hypothetical protein
MLRRHQVRPLQKNGPGQGVDARDDPRAAGKPHPVLRLPEIAGHRLHFVDLPGHRAAGLQALGVALHALRALVALGLLGLDTDDLEALHIDPGDAEPVVDGFAIRRNRLEADLHRAFGGQPSLVQQLVAEEPLPAGVENENPEIGAPHEMVEPARLGIQLGTSAFPLRHPVVVQRSVPLVHEDVLEGLFEAGIGVRLRDRLIAREAERGVEVEPAGAIQACENAGERTGVRFRPARQGAHGKGGKQESHAPSQASHRSS